jgi:low affinity Fe/Cu permease
MRRIFTQLGVYAANPFAFLILVGYGTLWYALRPESFEWHGGAVMATWFMTLVIQRAEHRDTQAIHAKLDEMLHALGKARNEMTRVDEEEPEEIEKRRGEMRRGD